MLTMEYQAICNCQLIPDTEVRGNEVVMIRMLANLLVLCISAVEEKYLHWCIDGSHESSIEA